MSVLTGRRLPGIFFRDEVPPLPEALPRMDIAAFVGFAAAGPLNTPVLVESMNRFRDIFGDDLPIAWDPSVGQLQYTHLASAVEAFFRNGGRRCWVARVAKGASANLFPVAGLVQCDNDQYRSVLVDARCEGSWSDNLRISAVLQSLPLNPIGFQPDPDHKNNKVYIVDFHPGTDQLRRHDLLRLSFGDKGPLLFLTIDTIAALLPDATSTDAQLFERASGQGHWFLRRPPSNNLLDTGKAFLLSPPSRPEFSPPLSGVQDLSLLSVQLPNDTNSTYAIKISPPPGVAPIPGDLVRIDFDGGQRLLLSVSQIEAKSEGSSLDEIMKVTASQGLWPLSADEGLKQAKQWQLGHSLPSPPQEQLPYAERLAFEFLVWQGDHVDRRIGDLAFAQDHTRFWANLPPDEQLFRLQNGRVVAPVPGSLEAQATDPRFPLAGPRDPADLYLPLGMPSMPGPALARGALVNTRQDTALERDGLKEFSATLFLDQDLAGVSARVLLSEAHHKLYVLRKPLLGLHSLLSLEEVTLIAIPDAVHRGWDKITPTPLSPLPAPNLSPVKWSGAQGTFVLRWSKVSSATAYILEEATEPTFSQPATNQLTNPDNEEESLLAAVPISGPRDCSTRFYYRVRALRGGETSPWSNTETEIIPKEDFDNCRVVPLKAPVLHMSQSSSLPTGDFYLTWKEVPGATGYRLQEATDPLFFSGATIFTQDNTFFSVARKRPGLRFYRVRAEREARSYWSAVCLVAAGSVETWTANNGQSEAGRPPQEGGKDTLCAPVWEPGRSTQQSEITQIRWCPIPGATSYILQESADPSFSNAATIYTGPATVYQLSRSIDSPCYYRVQAIRQEFSPWSKTEWSAILDPSQRWGVKPPQMYSGDVLLAVQRALLRFCAARADLLALLSVPNHYREDEIQSHLDMLKPRARNRKIKAAKSRPAQVFPLSFAEESVLGFGALYHPWITVSKQNTSSNRSVQLTPPDGAICGMTAARTIERGAWVAPANVTLGGVVALDPVISRSSWKRLFDAQVNVVQQNQRGFIVLSADTLNPGVLIRPINVRRLLILLRRLALREGMNYVFQPNDNAFRRRVQHKFEQVLGKLYTRGAFAGDSPTSAYQVVTDSSVNTPVSLELGRFIVELRVAPSRPLAFLTVRLIQTSQEGLTIQEVQ